jgi:uncharacterized protein with HEPN domain
MHDPGLTLEQIIQFCQEAIELRDSVSFDEMMADRMKRYAFERMMECVGEAVKRLPSELREQYPEIPWRLIAGMRDRISHGYDGIQHPVLWDAARNDLPVLLKRAGEMLAEIDGAEPEKAG